MQLLANTTSPFVRIVRVAMIEKGLDVEPTIVDPWADDVRLRAANAATRVPTLVLDDGTPLSECLLIVQWLDDTRPQPAVLGDDPVRRAGVLSRAGVAIGAIEASTITIITRKGYGGAYDVMGSKHLRGDLNLAWPGAMIAVMGAAGAAKIIYRRDIEKAADKAAMEAEKTAEYERLFNNPYRAAARGYIDDVVEASRTRSLVIRSLELLKTKQENRPPRKHGNIPL